VLPHACLCQWAQTGAVQRSSRKGTSIDLVTLFANIYYNEENPQIALGTILRGIIGGYLRGDWLGEVTLGGIQLIGTTYLYSNVFKAVFIDVHA
jgi:hypothetical protein